MGDPSSSSFPSHPILPSFMSQLWKMLQFPHTVTCLPSSPPYPSLSPSASSFSLYLHSNILPSLTSFHVCLPATYISAISIISLICLSTPHIRHQIHTPSFTLYSTALHHSFHPPFFPPYTLSQTMMIIITKFFLPFLNHWKECDRLRAFCRYTSPPPMFS